MTIEEAYINFTNHLKNIYEQREAANIADWVFENVAGIKRLDRITNKQQQLSSQKIDVLNEKLFQLLQHTPVQYVLNESWFYKMKLFVTEHVLIPRPETEELVEWIVNEKNKTGKINILDVGTGSGCIAIALKKNIPQADVSAIDVSKKALEVAKQNALSQSAEMAFLPIDFLDETLWQQLFVFDIIVSNPPYIPLTEEKSLDKNVTMHEPHIALFVDNNDPFIFYKKIASFATKHLKNDGKIYVEVHEKYANQVSEIFSQHHFSATIKKDMYGRERMVSASR